MKYPLIGLCVSIACLLLSFGLCGAAGSAGDTNNSNMLVTGGLIALGTSIVGGLVSFVWLIVSLIRHK